LDELNTSNQSPSTHNSVQNDEQMGAESRQVRSDESQRPDGQIRNELYTVSRIRSESEVPELMFLPRPPHQPSPLSIRSIEFLENPENLSSFRHNHNEHNTGNGGEPLAYNNPELDNEIDPHHEPHVNNILEEPREQNPELLPVENNEGGGNPEEEEFLFIPNEEDLGAVPEVVEMLIPDEINQNVPEEQEEMFIPDEDQDALEEEDEEEEVQDVPEHEEVWDHSEASEDLDNMEFPNDDDDDEFQDLPMDQFDENFILYALMMG